MFTSGILNVAVAVAVALPILLLAYYVSSLVWFVADSLWQHHSTFITGILILASAGAVSILLFDHDLLPFPRLRWKIR